MDRLNPHFVDGKKECDEEKTASGGEENERCDVVDGLSLRHSRVTRLSLGFVCVGILGVFGAIFAVTRHREESACEEYDSGDDEIEDES